MSTKKDVDAARALFDVLKEYGAGSMKIALHDKEDGPTTRLVIVAQGEDAALLERMYDITTWEG